jgi:tetratricopeptide (TPR) repeat protein
MVLGARTVSRFADAVAKMILHDPQDAVEAYSRGMEYLDYNEPDQAIAAFTEAIRLRPKYIQAWVARGYAHAIERDLDQAIADYTEAIRLDPSYASAYYNRSLVYREKGDAASADADQAKSVQLKGTRL